jgi:arylsulfatase
MKQKNVLFILADQLRKDTLGCYGNEKVITPNIDKLAAEGVQFNRCYVANPICMPNRLSLFTGMNIRNHSLWTNGVLLYQKKRTLADELKEEGYQTVSFGKIHFEPTYSEEALGSRESRHYWKSRSKNITWNGPYWGFEHVELTIDHTLPLAHYGEWFYQNGGTDEILEEDEKELRNIPEHLHDSTFVGERTVDFIKNNRDKDCPFFAVASFPDPHHPFNPPKELIKEYTLNDAILPSGSYEDLDSRPGHYLKHFRGGWHRSGEREEQHPHGVDPEVEKQRIINTYAMVNLIDKNVGKILDVLEEEDILEDTIIVFTSDHGELLGDHGLWYKGPFYYEGLLNTPCILKYDGCPISITEDLFSTIDVFPTVCDLVGISVPGYVDGLSFIDTQKRGVKRDSCLVEYRNGYGKNDVSSKAIINERYKYVFYETGEEELTDLKIDPQERKNFSRDPDYQSDKKEMKHTLLKEVFSSEIKWPDQITFA